MSTRESPGWRGRGKNSTAVSKLFFPLACVALVVSILLRFIPYRSLRSRLEQAPPLSLLPKFVSAFCLSSSASASAVSRSANVGAAADYHRKKLATDPEYRQVVRESQKQWWDEHPDYQKQRRRQNPKLVESNRQRQRAAGSEASPRSVLSGTT